MQTLEEFYREMWQCLISKNIPRLDEMHDDGFTLTHMTGMVQSKSAYLRAIQNGDLNYFSEDPDEIIVDAANGKMIGRSRVNAAVFGGGRHTWRLQLDFNVENQNGKWILKSAVASTY